MAGARRAPLRLVCSLGIVLALIFLGGILFLTYYTRSGIARSGGLFFRELQRYDAIARETFDPAPVLFNPMLDSLENNSLGVESLLSVLKRRRALALARWPGPVPGNSAYTEEYRAAYRTAAERCAVLYPYSEPLAAIAAEALILENPIISESSEAQVRPYHDLLTEDRFTPLALDIGVLLGDFADPLEAAAQSRRETLLASGISSYRGAERELFLINAALLSLLRNDTESAVSQVVLLLQSPDLSGRALQFAAEFFYNNGNPLRAAEFFSRFSDPWSLSRQADSLWLAGYPDGAYTIWSVLAAPALETDYQGEAIPDPVVTRSLYNLASLTENAQDKTIYYERLLLKASGENSAGFSQDTLGLLGYSRLFSRPRAVDMLMTVDPEHTRPLLDLELLRRRLEQWQLPRSVAETWLLLGRHPGDERLYQWGTYFFERQRQYNEITLLLNQARMNGLDGPWLNLHEAIAHIRAGRLTDAEALLQAAVPDSTDWQVSANLGLLQESRRAMSEALRSYETASSLVKDNIAAARIQLRIARCLRSLGRDREIRRVLEYAQDLDPDNLNVRLELHRLER
jgi:tetratricopeptide (TPR) repeat protein